MLWANKSFAEDAIANLLFAIEGALLLLQKKHGVDPKRIDPKALLAIFEEIFDNGKKIFTFIQNGYDKRIQIVHANPKSGPCWNPRLSEKDYDSYYDIAMMLLIYIITEDVVDIDYDPYNNE